MPGPVVADGDEQLPPATSAAMRDDRSRRRVLAGILEQVVEHALDQRRVELDQRQIARQSDFDAMPGERRLRRLERAADDFLERLPLPAQLDLAALDARHVEQIVDQRAHPPRLVGDRLRGLELRAGQRGLGQRERLGEADQRGERRAQVVRERGEQRIAQPLGLHADQRLLRDLDVVHALERDRGQRGERVELPPLLGHEQQRADCPA